MQARSHHDQPRLAYYQLFLSLRYLLSRFSALAALLSVTFGVAVIVIVLSIMGGYVVELRRSIREQESHLMILGPERFAVSGIYQLETLLSGVDNVKAVAPFVETLAMYRSGQFSPCHVRGIQPVKQTLVSAIGDHVLRPEELDRVLEELRKQDSTNRSEVETGTSADTAANRLLQEVVNAEGRPPLSPEELASFFGRDARMAVLEKYNPAVIGDLQGDIPPGCLVGIRLLLDRHMFLGQVVTIITLDTRTSEPVPRKFLVVGAFRTGDYNVDSGSIYVHVDTLKNMLGLFDEETNSYRYEGLRVAVKDLDRLQETKAAIESAVQSSDMPQFTGLRVLTWEQLRSNFIEAVRIEKFVIYFLLLILVAFAACMVLLMLLLTVIEKTRDVGVLLSLGATPDGIVWVFLTNGLILSVVGTVGGLALGYLFCLYINPIHDWIHATTGLRLFPAEIYNMDRIPIAFQPMDVLLSVTPPIFFGCLASLVPAFWAARRDPIKAIHNE